MLLQCLQGAVSHRQVEHAVLHPGGLQPAGVFVFEAQLVIVGAECVEAHVLADGIDGFFAAYQVVSHPFAGGVVPDFLTGCAVQAVDVNLYQKYIHVATQYVKRTGSLI